jgi:hypothetical protein
MTERAEIETRVKKVLAEQLAVDEVQVVPDARFAESNHSQRHCGAQMGLSGSLQSNNVRSNAPSCRKWRKRFPDMF